MQTAYTLYSTYLDAINAIVLMVDEKGRIKYFNRAFAQIFDQNNENIVDQPVWNIITPPHHEFYKLVDKDDAHKLKKFLDEDLKETMVIKRSGLDQYISWSRKIHTDESNCVLNAILTGINITEQKRLEKQLSRKQALFNSLINSIPDLIFYKDTTGHYMGCNMAFEAFADFKEDIVGLTDFDIYPAELANFFVQSDRQVLSDKNVTTYENVVQRSEGQTVVLETHKSPYYGPDSELLGTIGVIRDITKQKRNEESKTIILGNDDRYPMIYNGI